MGMEQMESEERDGFVSENPNWLNKRCVGQLRFAEVFILIQGFLILILFIVALSAGISNGQEASLCLETFTLLEPSTTTDGIHKLPTLPYSFSALEPYIDENTLRFHYYKHFNSYRTNLNSASSRTNLTEIQLTALGEDVKVRNNGGGYYNHGLFFSTLCRASSSGLPSKELERAIERDFGSSQQLLAAFEQGAKERFGSGWVWLGVDTRGKLKIVTTPNQDNPLMTLESSFSGTPEVVPFLGLDVWEHSYYLKYQNRRADYVKGWWKVINWDQVSRYYQDFALNHRAVEWWR